MKKKIVKQIDYYLSSTIFTIIYLVIILAFALLIYQIDENMFVEESLYYLKIIIIVLITYYFLYLNSSKLYEFSMYFIYQRKHLSRIYLRLFFIYSIHSSLLIFLTFNLIAYIKLEYFKIDFNLFFTILYSFSLVVLINGIASLLFNKVLGIIIIFFLNLLVLFMLLFDINKFFPNFMYENTYYFNIEPSFLYIYLLVSIGLFIFLFKIKERR